MKFVETSLKETIEDIKSSAQYCYDEQYIWWTAVTTPARGNRVVKMMKSYFNPQDKILDVGCSQGLTIGYIAQAFHRVEGIDIDKSALETAKHRLDRLGLKTKLHHYSGKRLPFQNNVFDGIVATEVFEHVDDRKLFISELHRVLKRGGKLLITAPNKLYPIECEFHLPFLSYLPKSLADIYVKLSKKGDSYDHIHHPTYTEFQRALKPHFCVTDITLSIIEDYKAYKIDQERGPIIAKVALVLRISENMSHSFLAPLSAFVRYMVTRMSAGWIFICVKT
jgi:ubiquinone/menaquinone biosynthesis C-methylase UbiE